MNAYALVKQRFIDRFAEKERGIVGVELEFPLLNAAKKPVEESVANGLLSHFLRNGFQTEETTRNGTGAFIANACGDVLSFDNSYNNFEFALRHGDDLCAIARRFYGYFNTAQNFLKQHNHLLTGMGLHPYRRVLTPSHVDYPVYNMVDGYLRGFPARHNAPDFPAYVSSAQTHLDVNLRELPAAATLFARLDFVRAALFSNAAVWDAESPASVPRGVLPSGIVPDGSTPEVLCYRDFLWEGSAFPNTGKVDETYRSVDDVIQSFLNRKMFNKLRGGQYAAFSPVPLGQYFENAEYGAKARDIEQFLSFRNIEITARGTLEVRSDCAQPLCAAFAPAAFSLGLLYRIEDAENLLKNILPHVTTTALRNRVITSQTRQDDGVPPDFALRFVQLAERGLKQRGKGEEQFLSPLYERARRGVCPARETLTRLKNGEPIEAVIADYSDPGDSSVSS
ncbi:MAG: hypothetical protein LBH54_00210 [Clostridiales bacterium]|jgi:gamma-glutamylcysteine synthetase|nr:hypothetical protein [Clostridiales bacterium]